jgi:hypothetical protein
MVTVLRLVFQLLVIFIHVSYRCVIMMCFVVSIFTYNYVISCITFLLRIGYQFHKSAIFNK